MPLKLQRRVITKSNEDFKRSGKCPSLSELLFLRKMDRWTNGKNVRTYKYLHS